MQMGCLFSKETGESPPATQTPSNLLLAAELSSYDSACRLDPELQSFDTALQSRTNRVINTLAADVELRSLSFDTLKEVTGSLLEMSQEVVKIILEYKKDVWKDQELFNLVEEFFENSLQMLDFCMALDGCLKRARDSQLIINIALLQFEAEGNGSLDDGKKYSRTLEELKNFKAAGDLFTGEFFQIFQSVHKQQISMLEKLQLRKSKINKKLKTVEIWRKVSCIIFASAFVAVLICAVVAAAVAAPPVAAALAAVTSVPLGSAGKWVDSLWRNYESELKRQKEVISTMWVGTFVAIKDLDKIRVLIDRLEVQIESLLQNADFALRGEEAVKVGIEEIKKRLEAYTESLEDLGNHIHGCSSDIRNARTLVVRKIISHPT